MKPLKFRVRLMGMPGMETAVLEPPFDVPAVFGTRARVPVKGAINGFPFRSSLMNMGDGHMMVVNRKLREGARCQAGDVVTVVMERDTEKRVVKLPAYLKKAIARDPRVKAAWAKMSFSHQREYVEAIEEAKKPETRQRRIAGMMAMLRKGLRKS